MDKTQRLVGIALAVLALEGCRGGAQQAQRPGSTPPPVGAVSGGSGARAGGGGFFGRMRSVFGESGAHGIGG